MRQRSNRSAWWYHHSPATSRQSTLFARCFYSTFSERINIVSLNKNGFSAYSDSRRAAQRRSGLGGLATHPSRKERGKGWGTLIADRTEKGWTRPP